MASEVLMAWSLTDRTTEILIQGEFVRMDFNDLRNGDLFRQFEPDGTPANDGGIWLATSNIYGDAVVPSIQAEKAGR